MNDFLAGLTRWLIRAVLVVAGLVIFLSLLAAVLVLALAWGLRAAWARLTGRPVTPWTMRVDPRTGWSRFTVPPSAGRLRALRPLLTPPRAARACCPGPTRWWMWNPAHPAQPASLAKSSSAKKPAGSRAGCLRFVVRGF